MSHHHKSKPRPPAVQVPQSPLSVYSIDLPGTPGSPFEARYLDFSWFCWRKKGSSEITDLVECFRLFSHGHRRHQLHQHAHLHTTFIQDISHITATIHQLHRQQLLRLFERQTLLRPLFSVIIVSQLRRRPRLALVVCFRYSKFFFFFQS